MFMSVNADSLYQSMLTTTTGMKQRVESMAMIYLRSQKSSSVLSCGQCTLPSHRRCLHIHWPLPHWNSLLLHPWFGLPERIENSTIDICSQVNHRVGMFLPHGGNFRKFPRKLPSGRNVFLPLKMEETQIFVFKTFWKCFMINLAFYLCKYC